MSNSHGLSRFVAFMHSRAASAHADGGGLLVDGRGKVIGVNIARLGRARTLAIPHTVVRELVDQVLATVERK